MEFSFWGGLTLPCTLVLSFLDLQAPYTQDWVKEKIFSDVTPRCEVCDGLVKPAIVFFGEPLPKRFFALKVGALSPTPPFRSRCPMVLSRSL